MTSIARSGLLIFLAASAALPAGQPLSITTSSLPPGAVCSNYGPLNLTATGGSGSYSWSATGLPTGLTASPAGVISGTPAASGSFSVDVSVLDKPAALSAVTKLPLSVASAPPVNVTTSSLPSGAVGTLYGPASLTATGGCGSYSWSATGLPPGLTVSSQGVIGGTPAAGGPFSVNIAVSDKTSGLGATIGLALTVTVPPLVISSSGSLAEFLPGAAISTVFAATGGQPPYKWSAAGLPGGLSLSTSGSLSGAAGKPGSYTFTVQVSDSQSPAATAKLNVTFSVFGIVSGGSLPAGYVSIPYSFSLQASGGTPMYSWSVARGALPAGVSLSSSGIVQGTPSAAGNFSFTAQATDASGTSATGAFTLTIATVPILTPNGTVSAFNPQAGAGLAPGEIVAIYGTNLAAQTMAATATPLVTSMAGTSVLIGGIPAPLYYVSPGQINAQVPFELTPDTQYQVQVNATGALSTPGSIQIVSVAPGIAAYASGQIIAQHAADFTLVSEGSPATPGEYIVFYLVGLGITDNAVPTGAATPASPLSHPVIAPILTLNDTAVPTAFYGLVPTEVGLYQIDFQVPAWAPNGDLALSVSQAGVSSNVAILPVQQSSSQ